jgi:hypothetical protein
MISQIAPEIISPRKNLYHSNLQDLINRFYFESMFIRSSFFIPNSYTIQQKENSRKIVFEKEKETCVEKCIRFIQLNSHMVFK